MTSLRFASLFTAVILCLGTVSCEKSQRDEDDETLAATENALAQHLFHDAWREVHRFAMRDSLVNDTGIVQWFDKCIDDISMSDTLAIFPLYLRMDYGDDRDTCNDGFTRFGILKATFTGKYLNEGSRTIISFEGYKKDRYSLDGIITVTNLGLDTNARRSFLFEVEEGNVIGTNTDIKWECTQTYVWFGGSTTDGIIDDDVFLISGTNNGRNSRGNTFFNEITVDYVADLSCQWIVSGNSELSVPNLATRYIDYGDPAQPSCDNILISTRNNTDYEIRIPYH